MQLAGVVVEVERQLGHAGLGIGRRVLVHASHRVAGRVFEDRDVRSTGRDRGWVAVGTGVEGERSLQCRQQRESGRGEVSGDAVEGTAGGGGHAERGGRVHVAVELPHAER